MAQGDGPATLTNTACYQANSEDQPASPTPAARTPTSSSRPAPPLPADLGVVKTVSKNIVRPGATITWNIVGTNYGPATSTDFVLADRLPAGVHS